MIVSVSMCDVRLLMARVADKIWTLNCCASAVMREKIVNFFIAFRNTWDWLVRKKNKVKVVKYKQIKLVSYCDETSFLTGYCIKIFYLHCIIFFAELFYISASYIHK